MKKLLLLLTVAILYSTTQTPTIQIKTAVIYQGNVIDMLDPSRPRIA